MKVSIVIPCFRQGRYLREAVDSCLRQTYLDVEVIVVNDGSDDDTDEVARSYGDRIRYVYKKNGGLCAARNSGIAIAAGRFLKVLDADDHLAPEQIAWQMEAMGGRQDRVGATATRAYRDGNPTEYTDMAPQIRDLMPGMLSFPDIPPHSWFFPMDLVKAVGGFRENYSPAGDWDFVSRLGRLRPTLCVDTRVGCYYRLRQGSMSTTNRSGTTLEVARTLIEFHDAFRDGPDREWFGPELLGAEQATYRRMLIGEYGDRELQEQLFRRLVELWREVGAPRGLTRKFTLLRRLLGYRLAEKVYASYIRHKRARSA